MTTEVMYDRPCYRLLFDDGQSVVADAEHLWLTEKRRDGRAFDLTRGVPRAERGQWRLTVRTTKEIAKTLLKPNSTYHAPNHSVALAGPLDLPDIDLPIPPYTLGVWLGDGNSDCAVISKRKDLEIVEHIRAEGVPIRPAKRDRWRLNTGDCSQAARDSSINHKLRTLGLLRNKHIPSIYLRASFDQRLALLQGLMDTDGYISKVGACDYGSIYQDLAIDVFELVTSFGIKSVLHKKTARLRGKEICPFWVVTFHPPWELPIFRLDRKAQRHFQRHNRRRLSGDRRIVECDPIESVPVRCISVDSPSRMYLCGKGMIPTHNSPLAAGIGLYMLVGDREPRAEVYAAAVDYDQAQILFRDAVAMRESSPELKSLLQTSGGKGRVWNLADLETGSFFRPIASDHKGTGKSGPRVHCALLDEVHEHPTRAMVEYMRAGTKGRRQALIFMITNSGFDRTTVCWDYHKMSERILTGQLENDAFFAYVCGLDLERKIPQPDGTIKVIPGDDWRDEKCWIKANPLLGVSISYKYLREQVREAEGMPSKQSIVQRLNFCRWTEGESFWLGQEVWEAVQAHLDIKDYSGRKGFIAVDISSKRDLTALALNIPLDDGSSAVFVWFWMPEDGVRVREDRDGVSYGLWRDQGFINTTPGPVVDLSYIVDHIMSLSQDIEIEAITCDTYRKDQLQIELDNIDCPIPLIEHPQGFRKSLNSEIWMPRSVEKTEERIVKRMVHINTNPCLTACAASVVMTEDAQGNKKPDKKKATGRIDGVVAMIEAIGITDTQVVQPEPSYNFFVLQPGY